MKTQYIVDTHVHLRDGVRVEQLLDVAAANFKTQLESQNKSAAQACCVLFMTESSGEQCFNQCQCGNVFGGWRFEHVLGEHFVLMTHEQKENIGLVRGQQIVCKENIEVLWVGGCDETLQGKGAIEVLDKLADLGGLVILPWGLGKWTGRRKRVVEEILSSFSHDKLLIGDTPLRGSLFSQQRFMQRLTDAGYMLLPGTDPLPIHGGQQRVGLNGIVIDGLQQIDWFAAICDALRSGQPIKTMRQTLGFSEIISMQMKTMLAKFLR